MTIKANTIRKISLNQPASPTPRAVPAVERIGVDPRGAIRQSDIRSAEDPTGELIGQSFSALNEFVQRVDQRKDKINTLKLGTQLEMETAGLQQQAFDEVDEPNQAPQRYLELHKQTTERILEQTDDQDVRLDIQTVARRQRAQGFATTIREVDRRQKAALGNELDLRIAAKQQQYAAAESPEAREAAKKEIAQLVETKKDEGVEALTDEGVRLQSRKFVQEANDMRAQTLLASERFGEADQFIEQADLDPSRKLILRRAIETARRRKGREAADALDDSFELFVATNGRAGAAGIRAAADEVAAFGTNTQQKLARAKVEAAQRAPNLLEKTLPEQAEELREMHRNAQDPSDIVTIRALSSMAQQQAQLYKEYPLETAARSIGVELNTMPEERTPDTLRQFFAQREEYAAMAEEKLGRPSGSLAPLRETEVNALKDSLDAQSDPSAGITMLTSMRRNLDPRRYSAVAGEIGADDPALAGGILVAGTGDFRLATQIWQGRKIMKSETSFDIPTKTARAASIESAVGNSFEAIEHPNAAAAFEQAALAHAHAVHSDTHSFDSGDFENSLEAVAGKRLEGGELIGDGFVEINGQKMPNPIRGASEDFILSAWESVDLADLTAYTVEGVSGPPMMNNGAGQPVPLPREALRSVRLRVRDLVAGTFEVQGTDGLPLQDRDGNPYVVRLSDMLLESGPQGEVQVGTPEPTSMPEVLY